MEHENITPQESVCRGEEEEKEALVWEEICTEHVVQDQWIDFRRSSYRLPDGSVFAPFYTYSRRDYVVIVATDEDGNCLCVRQFRQGIRQVTTEFPAGGIERTDGREYGPVRPRRRMRWKRRRESFWRKPVTYPTIGSICSQCLPMPQSRIIMRIFLRRPAAADPGSRSWTRQNF